jgi:hypothetical protein
MGLGISGLGGTNGRLKEEKSERGKNMAKKETKGKKK